MSERDEFWAGRERGLDPQPAREVVNASGDAVTSPGSWWNHTRCTSCGQTFRRGDHVRVIEGTSQSVIHADPWLDCPPREEVAAGDRSVAHRATADTSGGDRISDAAEFAAGLLGAYPVAGKVPVIPLKPDDWRVARPGGILPPRCLYCGHTFRAGEHVVVCPCRPHDMLCGTAVHRDPAAGLNCWEAWRPDSSLSVCPVTLSRVGEDGG